MDAVVKNRLAGLVSDRAADHLRGFRRDAEALLPGRVVDVMLFGSRARGKAKRGSDYDVVVFVDELNDSRAVNHALSDTALPYMLSGTHIRPISVPVGYLTKPHSNLLASEIARDGISIDR